MSTHIGRDAAFKINGTVVSEMTNWSIDVSADVIREDVFGSTWAKKHGISATDWTAEVSGLLDLNDTTGQEILWNAIKNGTLLQNVEFWVDSFEYYTPDTETDANAGCYVTSFNPGTAQGDVARFTATFEGTGPIHRDEET